MRSLATFTWLALGIQSLALTTTFVAVASAIPPPPTITGVSPRSGPVGIPVTVTGTNFEGATAVTFYGYSATFTVTSGTVITATVPAGAISGPISVTTPGGSAWSQPGFVPLTTCTQWVDPQNASFAASGGSGSANVTADASCSWTAGAAGRGLTVTSGGLGTGNGTVTYAVAPNYGAERDGEVWIGMRAVTVHQAGWLNDLGAGLVGVQDGSVAWGDYDKDGDLDILLTGYNFNIGEIARLYRNDGGGVLTDTGTGLTPVYDSSVAWGDYDKDGDPDILLTGHNTDMGGVARLYRNDVGSFTDTATALTGVSSSSVAWGDYDNDGDLDILLTGWTGSGAVATVYRNDGSGEFTDTAAGLTGVYTGSVAWGDYDSDNDLDILLTGRSDTGPIAKVYRNNGGAFEEIAAGLTGVEFSAVAWGDYDRDGDPDVLLAGRSGVDPASDVTKAYRNDGGGVFTDIEIGLAPTEDGSVAWVDYDNDGDLDISLNGIDLVAKLYRNDGGGAFTDTDLNLRGTQGPLVWGDYDGDGDLDVLLAGHNGSSGVAEVYRANRAPGAFFTLTPCRLVDTRNATGILGGPALVAGADRLFPLFGHCGIPATASAVSLNLTVTQATTAGHFRLYAAGSSRPSSSSINFAAGQARANNAVVSVNGLGELAVHSAQASGTAHFVLDVTGYFE